MLTPRRFAALLIIYFAAVTHSVLAQSSLTGTVTNSATGRVLEGARVSVKGTNVQAVTDRSGSYTLENLAAGPVVIDVYYSGLDTATANTTVQPGPPSRLDVNLTSSAYKLDKFVVAGEREGNAQAVTLQRASAGVKNIVSTDIFGNLVGNPADLLVRLPGVEGTAVDGTIRYVRVRGLNQNLTTVTMDGNRIADAASAGSTREYQFQTVSADTIERMEVVKSPTPDMDGDSIGGAVNMVSKSGFDSRDRQLRGTIGGTYRPLDVRSSGVPYNYQFSYSEVFGGKIAVAVNFGHRQLFTPQDEVNMTYQGLANGVAGPAYAFQERLQDARLLTSRWGGGLRLDYKLSEHNRIYVGTTVNHLTDHDDDRWATYTAAQNVATLDASGNPTGTNSILPGYTNTFTAVRAVPNSTFATEEDHAHKDAKTLHHQLGGVYDVPALKLDWNVYKSDSKTDYPGQRHLAYTARSVGFTIDQRSNLDWPKVTQTGGPNLSDLNSYTENRYTIDRRAGWDAYRGLSLNIQKELPTSLPAYIKTGVRVREQDRILQASQWTGIYVGLDGVMGPNPANGINDDNLSQFGLIARGRMNTNLVRYPDVPAPAFPQYSNKLIDTALETSPQLFRRELATNLQRELTGDQRFNERISAAYLMGNVELGKFSVLAGFRVERTKAEGVGALQVITPEEKIRRAAFVGALTDAEITRRTIAEFGGRQTRTGQYTDVLPGIHLKYSPRPQFIARLSYATNIGRPGIGQLIPATTANFDTQTVSTSNPSLRPQTARNYDLSVEYYFEPAGIVSAAVFRKELKNFIYTSGGAIVPTGAENGFGGSYAGYSLTTQYNGGSATVQGFELNYSQQYTFLPGIFRGLGSYANYTHMETEGNYGSGSAISLTPNPKGQVAGFNPETMNAGISYIRKGLTVRFQFNHRARYLSTYNVDTSRMTYTIKRDTLDFKTEYQFSRNLSAYLDVNNILRDYESGTDFGDRPNFRRILTPAFFFGVKFRQ